MCVFGNSDNAITAASRPCKRSRPNIYETSLSACVWPDLRSAPPCSLIFLVWLGIFFYPPTPKILIIIGRLCRADSRQEVMCRLQRKMSSVYPGKRCVHVCVYVCVCFHSHRHTVHVLSVQQPSISFRFLLSLHHSLCVLIVKCWDVCVCVCVCAYKSVFCKEELKQEPDRWWQTSKLPDELLWGQFVLVLSSSNSRSITVLVYHSLIHVLPLHQP